MQKIGNDMREQEIINNFKNSLKQLLPIDGLSIKPLPKSKLSAGVDLAADVRFEKLQFEMLIEVVAGNSLPILRNKIARLKAFADQKRDAVPVLVAPYLSPERQKLCRNEGVDFIDLSGNVHLHYKSLYIDKRGLPNRFPEKRYGRNPYYKNSIYYGSQIVDGLRVVSDIQLYLDLYGYPIRGLEQAEHIFNHCIKPDMTR